MKCGSSFCTGSCCSFRGSSSAVCRRTYKWDCLPAGSAWDAQGSCFAEGTCPGVSAARFTTTKQRVVLQNMRLASTKVNLKA
jgi:hypothetical protein